VPAGRRIAVAITALQLTDANGAVVYDPVTGRPAYNPLNRWNSGPVVKRIGDPASFSGGAMHLTSTPNTLQTELGLAGAATPQYQSGNDDVQAVADFGKPGNTAETVWESFLEASQVFDAKAPTARTALAAAWTAKRPAIKSLSRLSKFGDAQLNLESIEQAGSDGWLTDQAGNLVFYEVRLNQDEYEFITMNGLTTFTGQTACASRPRINGQGGFNLPAGSGTTGRSKDYDCKGNPATYGQNSGAIEIKAAWRVLPADGSLNGRYRIANALLHRPDGSTQKATVGLIGLHILHKMPSAPQLVWATFEPCLSG
jgi:hypothetical protein